MHQRQQNEECRSRHSNQALSGTEMAKLCVKCFYFLALLSLTRTLLWIYEKLAGPWVRPLPEGFTLLKGAQSRLNGLKSLAKLFNFVVCNPGQSSSSLTILVSLWFIIISLMFFYLTKVLLLGFLQFNGNFVDAQNNSKYRDWAPLRLKFSQLFFSCVLMLEF